MEDDEIKDFIDRLNNNDFEETIFLRQLNENVDFAKVWKKKPELNDEIDLRNPSYRFFFIKNENGKYVAAVLDMTIDLHWYVLEEERKKGYLTKSLREAIIPYLFYEEEIYERDKQRITIGTSISEVNHRNSRKVAEAVGFKLTNEKKMEFTLKKEEFDWGFENFEERNGTISESRFNELRKRLVLSYRELLRISDELLMSYNEDEGLKDVAKEVRRFHGIIEDIELENEKK